MAVTVVLETSFLEHLNNPGWNAIVETIVKPAGFTDMQPKPRLDLKPMKFES